MLELLLGFGFASLVGAGATYASLMVFALLFPNGFRVAYWMFMLPVMSIGTGSMLWFFGGFFVGWSIQTYQMWMVLGTILGFGFCWVTSPNRRAE